MGSRGRQKIDRVDSVTLRWESFDERELGMEWDAWSE